MVIKVPDIVHPTFCYKQCIPAKPPFDWAMWRCTFPKGHLGPHTWERVDPVPPSHGQSD